MTTRVDVYAAIDTEREYQVARWNRPTPDRTIDEWAMYFEVYSRQLCDLAAHTNDDERVSEKLSSVRKIAAMCVACMEQHGAPKRSRS
jgi:hypothetical protein